MCLVRCIIIGSRAAVCRAAASLDEVPSNVQLTPSSGISSASAVRLVRCIIGSRAEVSRLPASVCGTSGGGLRAASLDEVPSNAQLTPSSGISSASAVRLVRSSSAAGQRSAACLRSNSAACASGSGLPCVWCAYHQQQGRGQPPACIRLRHIRRRSACC